ncbi:MFS transporter [Microbacterium sp. STN6]|uniref:MFS transporter n=1 Tax=Microbacterium sp. STN6 TaxID=2995588 RepID=UPI0022608761|nr:MFS transporter [Microbacterium sp. STN6]MCX7523018.1 MFS transporter [Microbacterium sp. STN6]
MTARRRWFGLVFISIAVSLIIVDSTIVNVAIPSIVDDLGISSTQVQWVQESYTLVFAALLIVFGTLADRFGRRRMMTVGVVVFVLSSLLAALAPNGELLIAARVVQGIGGAMVLPTTLSLINATFRGRDRAVAFAVWGSTIGGMAALGPLLGGWLTTDFSWRWAFGINLPLGAIAVIGAMVAVQESKEADAGRVDIVGAILSVLTAGSLVFGLIEGRTYGWWLAKDGAAFGDWTWPLGLSPIPLVFALTLVAGVLFVAWGLRRQKRGQSAMIAFSLFRLASFRNGNIAALVVSLGELGMIFSLPLWLQNVLGYSALQAGLMLVALASGSFVSSGLVHPLSQRMSAVAVVRIGLACEIVGVLGIGFFVAYDTPWYAVVPSLFVYGIGIGFATAQLTGVILRDVPVERSGQASGTQSTARQVGSALGIAILGTILFTGLGNQFDSRLDARGLPAAQREQVVTAVVDSSGAAIPSLAKSERTRPLVRDAKIAFSDATKFAAFSAAGFLTLGFLATLSLGPARDERSAEREPTARVTGASSS